MNYRLAALMMVVSLAAGAALPATSRAAFPGANGLLAFDDNGGVTLPVGNIYTIKPDGTDLVQLTTDDESIEPAWSPNGRRIAFSRRGFIFVMTAQGKWPRKVARLGHSYQPAWSPNGKQIAFTHMGDIWIVRAAGGTPTRLTNDGATCGDSDPTWSPLGGVIAFSGCGDVVLLRLKSGTKHTINDAYGPDFTADGRGLVFSSLEDWQDGQDGGNYPGPQFQSSDLTGAHRNAYSKDLCAEGAPCQFGNVAAAPTSTLANPQGVYLQEFEGQEPDTFGGFCVSTTAGLTTGYCQWVPDTTLPLPTNFDWQPLPPS